MRNKDPWYVAGWKIHLSIYPADYANALAALRLFHERMAPTGLVYKYARSRQLYEGFSGEVKGKFATIYCKGPTDVPAIVQLINLLFTQDGLVANIAARLAGMAGIGQVMLTDRVVHAARLAGLKQVLPSTPYDVKGLLKTAIRSNDPVLFFEHKRGYEIQGEVPEDDYTIPFGQAIVRREGSDVTVVAVSIMVHRALAAAEELSQMGIECEVIDPRTVYPFDYDTVIESLTKTHRLVVTHGWTTARSLPLGSIASRHASTDSAGAPAASRSRISAGRSAAPQASHKTQVKPYTSKSSCARRCSATRPAVAAGGTAPADYENVAEITLSDQFDPDSTPENQVFNRTITLRDTWAKIQKAQQKGKKK